MNKMCLSVLFQSKFQTSAELKSKQTNNRLCQSVALFVLEEGLYVDSSQLRSGLAGMHNGQRCIDCHS